MVRIKKNHIKPSPGMRIEDDDRRRQLRPVDLERRLRREREVVLAVLVEVEDDVLGDLVVRLGRGEEEVGGLADDLVGAVDAVQHPEMRQQNCEETKLVGSFWLKLKPLFFDLLNILRANSEKMCC